MIHTIEAYMGTTRINLAGHGRATLRSTTPEKSRQWLDCKSGLGADGKPLSTMATHWKLVDESGKLVAMTRNPKRADTHVRHDQYA